MALLNDFETLGIGSEASIAQIKKAYRTKAKEFHPDINRLDNAAEKFISISEAYQRIVDFKEGRYHQQPIPVNYEELLKAKANEQAKMRYREWKQKLDEEERNRSIHEIFWNKRATLILLLITIIFLSDQIVPGRFRSEKIIKATLIDEDKLYYHLETTNHKIEIESNVEINGLELNNWIIIGETPLLHSLKNLTTLQNKSFTPENIVGNFTPALIINIILLLLNIYFPFKTYHQKLWIKTLLIICTLYYLVSFLQA